MRGFLRKVWKNAATPDSFENVNALNLAAELQEKVREADDEWAKIDRDLIKWFGTLGSATTATILSGAVGWVPAGISAAVAGATVLAVSQHQRNSFEKRYPAGFFLKLKKKNDK